MSGRRPVVPALRQLPSGAIVNPVQRVEARAMDDIITIDCHYLGRPQFAAAYLLVEGGEAAFVDNNTNHALPYLLSALDSVGLSTEQVRYLIVTHVHLDHAGATASLAKVCPNATVLAHPRAAVHLIDPDKLVTSATQVYGAAEFERLYGRIEALPEARVRIMDDDERLRFGRRELTFLHTRGHANHHFCIADDKTNSIFTGDAFGLHYPALQGSGSFTFPSTSPTDFDPELARQAVRRIAGRAPERIYPTHFGELTKVGIAAQQLLNHLDFAEQLLLDAVASELADDELERYLSPRLRDYFAGLLARQGGLGRKEAVWALLDLDIALNAQGIAVAAAKLRRKAREANKN